MKLTEENQIQEKNKKNALCVVCYVKLDFFFSLIWVQLRTESAAAVVATFMLILQLNWSGFPLTPSHLIRKQKVTLKKQTNMFLTFLATWKMCQKCEKHSNSTGNVLDAHTLIISPIPEVWSGIDQVWSFGTIFTQSWQRNIKNRHILLHFFGIII